MGKFWFTLDGLVHSKLSWLPRSVRFWVCDKFDESLGMYDED